MYRLVELETHWVISLLVLVGLTIWLIFKKLASLMMYIAAKIDINRVISLRLIVLLSGLCSIMAIYSTWTLPTIYTGKIIVAATGTTILILELTMALIYGASSFTEPEDHYQKYAS